MSENQTTAQASSRSLRVLLLVCAGALVIFAFTLASAIYDAQQVQAMRSFSVASQHSAHGPEADPYLRHVPGGYDYGLDSPPEVVP